MSDAEAAPELVSHDEQHFGPWRLLRRIGEGGFADVFLAEREDDPTHHKTVLKRLHPHLCDQAEMVDMFETEAKVLGELDHPGIVRFYNLERGAGGRLAMVMEWVPGLDLAQVFDHALTIGAAIPLSCAVQLVVDVAVALHNAHERLERDGDAELQIVHRDIKPDNLLVDRTGQVKLIDFGCAKATLQTHLTRPGIRKGTLEYMSPEQCLGRKVDRRNDVFSLGVVLYELVTMTRMYADTSDARVMERIVHEVARPPSWQDHRINASLDLAILRALEKRPEDRYGTAAEMARALRWWLDRYSDTDDPHAKLGAWLSDDLRLLSAVTAPAELTQLTLNVRADLSGAPQAPGAVALIPDRTSGRSTAPQVSSGGASGRPPPRTSGRFPSAQADAEVEAIADPLQVVFRPTVQEHAGGGLVLLAPSGARLSSNISVSIPAEHVASTSDDRRETEDVAPPNSGASGPKIQAPALHANLERRTNLPPEPVDFFGRDAELAHIEAHFASGVAVVELSGPPGIGKSAVARASAMRLLVGSRRMPGGVWWIACDDIVDDVQFCQAIAGVLSITTSHSDDVSWSSLGVALAARGPMRLILDGCDRMDRSADDAIDGLVEQSEELEILVTRQVTRAAAAEGALELVPLEVPRRADGLAASPVGKLFARQVARSVPGFALNAENSAPALALLRGLRGMPGAICQAAAQVNARDLVASVAQLVATLPTAGTQRLTALDDAALGAALDWAWQQTTEAERQLLAGASLFHGGFDLAAAAAVLRWMRQGTAPAPAPGAVSVLLDRLRERNLVASYEPAELPGTSRFQVVRSVRDFARDRLIERSDSDAARRGHADYYLELGAELQAATGGPDGRAALQRLRMETLNLVAIVQRACRVQPPTERSLHRALMALVALWPVSDRGGRHDQWCEMAPITLVNAALLGDGLDPHATAKPLWLAALLDVLCNFARACLRAREPNLAAAGEALKRAHAVAAFLDEEALSLVATVSAEHVLLRGDSGWAAQFLQVAIGAQTPRVAIAALLLKSRCERAAARLEAAVECLDLALDRAEAIGAEHAGACAWLQRGSLNRDLEQPSRAAADLQRAHAIFASHGDDARAAQSLVELAKVANSRGDPELTRELLRKAAAAYGRIGRDDLVAPLQPLTLDLRVVGER